MERHVLRVVSTPLEYCVRVKLAGKNLHIYASYGRLFVVDGVLFVIGYDFFCSQRLCILT